MSAAYPPDPPYLDDASVPAELAKTDVRCCVCGSEDAPAIARGFDYEYRSSRDAWSYKRCRECALVFLDPRPAVSELGRIYPPTYYSYDEGKRGNPLVAFFRGRLEAMKARAFAAVAGEGPKRVIDVGCGDGAFLEVLAPIFERVIGVDRSPAQLDRARRRLARRQYANVELRQAELGDDGLASGVGADAVFAARVLHHASRPARAFASLAELATPGGAIVLLDYARHDDERLRAELADAWLGFSEDELLGFARDAGLEEARLTRVPAARCGDGPDGHLDWMVLVARRPPSTTNEAREGGMEKNA